MPGDIVKPCPLPFVDIGIDARLSLAEHRLALVECKKRHEGSIDFYNSVRRNFGSNGNK